MNKVSLAINAVLVIAVAVLFYLYTSLNGKVSGTDVAENPTEAKASAPKLITDPSKLANAKIAYINLDSLNMKYDFITEKSKEIKGRQTALETQYTSMVAKFQKDYEDLQQAAQAGLRSEADLQRESERLQQRQYEIANKEKVMQNLAEEVASAQANMLGNVSKFIEKFNNGKYDYILAYTSANISTVLYAKPDLEITNEVVAGLNEEYKQSKAAAAVTPKK